MSGRGKPTVRSPDPAPENPPATILWKPGDPSVGLYVHVPFCRSICTYCAFAKGEYDPALAEAWLDGIESEARFRSRRTWAGRPVLDTVFIGGGTPSSLSPNQWSRLAGILRRFFVVSEKTEFTSEANPESFSPEAAEAMRRGGVNRVSFGAQSTDSRELKMLGRIHGAGEIDDAVSLARRSGMDSVNLDLMYGLPGQNLDVFGESLDRILDLAPDHVSAYCLGLEPGTVMAEQVGAGTLATPDDDRSRLQYELLVKTTAARGLDQYEISNFARPGHFCRHNLRYWNRAGVLALGPSSHALLNNHTWANPAPLENWLKVYRSGNSAPEPRAVQEPEARFEWIFLNLRLVRGLSLDRFQKEWGFSMYELYGEVIDVLVAGGLLELDQGWLRLTPRARFVSDAVFSEFAPAS